MLTKECSIEDFTFDGRYRYDFLPSGFFTLVDKTGASFYDTAVPLAEKLVGHLTWIFCWVALLLASGYFFPSKYLVSAGNCFYVLILMHMIIFSFRLVSLLTKGGIRPIFFPPLWIRLTKKIQRGEGIELLKLYGADCHPGLLSNLAIAQYLRNDVQNSIINIRKALSLCPEHPALLQISSRLSSIDTAQENGQPNSPDNVADRC